MNQDKMRRCWPAGSAEIIGARMEITRREQQTFALPRHKLSRRKDDRYGSDTPVPSFMKSIADIAKIWATAFAKSIKSQWADKDNRAEFFAILGVCVVLGLCWWTLAKVLPGAIDGLAEHSRQVVAESREAER